MGQAIRILIVDDHPVVREGLATMLGRRAALAVVGQAADGAQAVELARRLKPDVVLMDLRMPVLDGVAATRRILADGLPCKVLVLTTFDQDELVLAGLRAGARGYILKDSPPEDIVHAIEAVWRGEAFLHPVVAAKLLQHVAGSRRDEGGGRGAGQDLALPEAKVPSLLSPREAEVMAWLARGLSNKEIAEKLGIASSTVKSHLDCIYGKLCVTDRTAAVAEAIRRRLLDIG